MKPGHASAARVPHDASCTLRRAQVDEDGSKEIEFQEFVHAIQINKAMSEKSSNEQETLDAFVALGGNVSGSPRTTLSIKL